MTEKTLKPNCIKAGKSSTKPLIERQRRARINLRLEEIKDLILSFLYHDDPQMYSEKSCVRMDKAEILDFAVDFIKSHRTYAPYKPSKQFPVSPGLELFLAQTLPYPSPVLLPLPLPPTANQQFFPRNMAVQPFHNVNGYPTNYLYGLERTIPSPTEVKGTAIALKSEKQDEVWRPWS